MFDSPLHYCAICRQYLALDQLAADCARAQDCKVHVCPYADLLATPAEAMENAPAAEASLNKA
jgi:hypothetical protein